MNLRKALPAPPGRLLLYGLLVLVIALPSIEAGVRLRLLLKDPHRFEPGGLFTYPPNTQVGETVELVTNNAGFFGVHLDTPKPAGTYRVFLMGSSPLTSPKLPAAMSEDLEKLRPDVQFEVNTTGLPRYTSYHNVLLFQRHLVELEPDCIVLYLGMNDNVYNTNPGLEEEPPAGLWDWRDLSRSVVLDMLDYHIIHKRFMTQPGFQTIRSAPIFEAHLRQIIEPARAHGIDVLLVPMLASYPTEDDELLAVIRTAEGGMRHFWGDLEPGLEGLAAHHAVMEKLSVEYGLPLLKIDGIPHASACFRDLCHFTDAGLDLLGQHFAEAVAAQL
ncbi:MAG: hypothetical protein KJ052_10135 [Candidatus Hydrogenedentes bacterium]|nr:hypothetical protein [Candidatus Hydrogenedentota bacterium]